MRTTLGKSLFVGLSLVGAAVSPAFAQQKAKVDKLVVEALPSPEFSGGGKQKSFKPKDWMEAEAEINLAAMNAEQKKTGFVDTVTVKWHVAFQNPDGKGSIKLSKDITYVNVPLDEAVFVSVYLSPGTLKRVTGKDRFDKGAIIGSAMQLLVNGQQVAESHTGPDKWWESSQVSDMSSKFPLLNKNETPFKVMWWDRYADIEEKR